MRLLLHTCCAVCLAGAAEELRGNNIDFTAFFCNPNVHPLLEWRKRLKAARVLCEREKIPLDVDEAYGLVEFLRAVAGRDGRPARCEICYRMRFERVAERAKSLGFDGFSTTLLVSADQDLALVRRVASEVAAPTGVAFVALDLANAHERGTQIAKKLSLYRQQYCGCIYSECDRYRDTRDELYRGPST